MTAIRLAVAARAAAAVSQARALPIEMAALLPPLGTLPAETQAETQAVAQDPLLPETVAELQDNLRFHVHPPLA